MSKFAFLVNDDGYRKYTTRAVVSGGAKVPCFKNDFLKRLFRIHNARPLNELFELPLKCIWYHSCCDEIGYKRDDDIFFVFYESFYMSYSIQYLKYLKKKYRNAKLVFYYSNPVDSYNLSRFKKVEEFYDGVVTFNKDDAEKYGYILTSTDPFDVKIYPINNNPQNDIFFIGADKGRLDFIISVFEHCKSLGMKCDFYIVDVNDEKKKYDGEIIYNKRISYEEVLQHINNSKCILEVLKDNCSYCSIRTIESIQFQKKLITTNKYLKEFEYYEPETMISISNANEITKEFVNQKVNYEILKHNLGSFEDFADFLKESVQRKTNKMAFK